MQPHTPTEIPPASPSASPLVLFGRSSSHFTRVTRILAAELGVAHGFRIVPDLLSQNPSDYGGNPALRLPVLHAADGEWFGALNVCRALARHRSHPARVVWPEDLDRLAANAQELTLQAMASEVALIMARVASADESAPHLEKQRTSLEAVLAWLERHVDAVIASLPAERVVSFLEVALFCLVTHVEFRAILPTRPYRVLGEFCERFARRPSAQQTGYRFD